MRVDISFQPKGGMCANCIKSLRDCSHYDFSKMIKISKVDSDGTVIVRCSHYENIKDAVEYERRFL